VSWLRCHPQGPVATGPYQGRIVPQCSRRSDRKQSAYPRDRGESAYPRDRGESAYPRDRGESAYP